MLSALLIDWLLTVAFVQKSVAKKLHTEWKMSLEHKETKVLGTMSQYQYELEARDKKINLLQMKLELKAKELLLKERKIVRLPTSHIFLYCRHDVYLIKIP